MLKKLKKNNQTPAVLENITEVAATTITSNKNAVEVVPQTPIETAENGLTMSQNGSSVETGFHKLMLETYTTENCSDSQSDKSKFILNYCEKNNENIENNPKVIERKSIGVNKCDPFRKSAKKSDILVTRTLKQVQKKSLTRSTEKSVQFSSTPNEVSSCSLVSQGSVTIDKQLSVTAQYKTVKCNYTILNNDQINILRKHAQEAVKRNKIFTIRGNYNSVRVALKSRGWVEKLETHRRSAPFPSNHSNSCDLLQVLPKRRTGETHRQFVAKVEKNIMSRCIENVLCDFLWTPHKEKAYHLKQTKNPNMLINKFDRAPFTNKENLSYFLRDIAAFYEEGIADINFPRCFNVWSPEELGEFIDNFKLTACIAFIRWLVDKYNHAGCDAVFSPAGKIPFNSIDFAFKRCLEYIEACQHNDIDIEDPVRIWEHEWDSFLHQHYQMTHEGLKIQADPQKLLEIIITRGSHILENIQSYWPQHSIDGYQNLWIIKPANKCRGRGIHLSNNLKKIVNFINPSLATKSRFVIQKYMGNLDFFL